MKKTKAIIKNHGLSELRFLLICAFVFSWIYMIFSYKHPVQKEIYSQFDSQNENNAVYVDFKKHPTKQWYDGGNPLQGAQFDGIIYNNTNGEIQDWTVLITVPSGSYVESSWNGKFGIDDDLLTVIVDKKMYNHVIYPHNRRTFGCIMYSEESFVPSSYRIIYSMKFSLRKSKLFATLVILSFAYLIYLITSSIYMIRIRILEREEMLSHQIIEQSLKMFAKTIEIKDEYTKGHSVRVGEYAKKLAEELNLPKKQIDLIYYSALLHDVGKIIIPNTILNKKTPLTSEEKNIMKSHVLLSYEILKDFTAIENVSKVVRHHHENYDGTGYPDGLKGEKIPLESRVITIADNYDAMTSSRGYNVAMKKEQAIEDMLLLSGKKYDPNLLPVFIKLLNKEKN